MSTENPILEETFVEIECSQKIKTGQSVCGDDFQSIRLDDEARTLAVLSDGLGSGIKAALLSKMTTTMALKLFRDSNVEIVQAAEIIMDSLPVCEKRKISYATFTVADVRSGGRVRIIEMDNPRFIHLRAGKDLQWDHRTMYAERWPNRKLEVFDLKVIPDDRIIFFSDGVSQAGLGFSITYFGWRREGCLKFIQETVANKPDISARDLSRLVVTQALLKNPEQRAIDDISCTVIYLRRPRRLRLLTGPPFKPDRDREFAETALNFDGKVIVSGGTTASILSRELSRPLKTDWRHMDAKVPPSSKMDGIALVTEGILTLTELVKNLETGNMNPESSTVKRMMDIFLESDVVELIVGTKVNEAHQDPNLPVDLEIRRNIVKKLKQVLEEKYLKKVIIRYF